MAEFESPTCAPGWSKYAGARMSDLTIDDLRDLQVWQKLAWIDPFYLDADPRVRRLIEKDRLFEESDKQVLRQVELELLNKVIPEDLVLDKQSLPKVKMPHSGDYAKLPDWKPGTPRLKDYPF